MRHRRELLSVFLVTSTLAAATAACSSDLTVADDTPDSGIVGGNDGGNTGTVDAGVVKAGTVDTTIYLGKSVTLDGTTSQGPAGFTSAWTLESDPASTSST
jgi:hypothetical protein